MRERERQGKAKKKNKMQTYKVQYTPACLPVWYLQKKEEEKREKMEKRKRKRGNMNEYSPDDDPTTPANK